MKEVKTEIIGTCVFRNEGDGCLTAKYMNASVEGPFVECCVRLEKSEKDSFIGEYKTTWIEDGNICKNGILKIDPHYLNKNLFELTWTDASKIIFKGHGMLFEKLLVTAYWE